MKLNYKSKSPPDLKSRISRLENQKTQNSDTKL